jgi:hypothetical protein
MATLYAGIKNTFSRNALAKTLTAIVAATTDTAKQATTPPTNFLTVKADVVAKLVAADATLVLVKPSTDGGKTQDVMASAAGIAAVQSADPIVEKPKVVHTAGEYKIEKGVALPTINRGGDRSQLYPFDEMEVGDSFFVPVSETMPNPGKTLASTVSSATRRYKSTDPAVPSRVFTIRANVNQVEGDASTAKGARIWRIAPAAATPAQASGENAAG